MIICQYNLLYDGQRSSSIKLSIKLQLDLLNNLAKYMEQLRQIHITTLNMHVYFSLVSFAHKSIVWLTKLQTNVL